VQSDSALGDIGHTLATGHPSCHEWTYKGRSSDLLFFLNCIADLAEVALSEGAHRRRHPFPNFISWRLDDPLGKPIQVNKHKQCKEWLLLNGKKEDFEVNK
jgi:hypothetical protein